MECQLFVHKGKSSCKQRTGHESRFRVVRATRQQDTSYTALSLIQTLCMRLNATEGSVRTEVSLISLRSDT
jgi:hypothetical protein